MTDIIEYFFDFSSPYGYFASFKIDDIAEKYGRRAVWKPVMIGAAFHESGNKPLIEQPIKGEYSRRDWERLGRYMEVPWVLPDPFPIPTLAAARAFYWINDQDSDQAKLFAKAAYHAYFGEGRPLNSIETVAGIGSGVGVDGDQLAEAVEQPEIKARLKQETSEAIGRGVFGSPFFFIDGEGFWGADRLWMLREWLKDGGF